MKMKRAILITMALLVSLAPVPAAAKGGEVTYTVLLAGGEESNAMHIWLSSDGRSYVIESKFRSKSVARSAKTRPTTATS